MKLPIWTQAAHQAAQTPPNRNRYIDFLRAASICLVILGHWLVVAIHIEGNRMDIQDLISVIPWTNWLTWLFQVMPIFFLVGGYVNALGWQSAQRRQESYTAWLARRLQRLILPVLPVLAVWTLIGFFLTGRFNDISFNTILLKNASQFALLPAWFLVVYILMILLTPLSYRAWQRYGFNSFWAPVAAAALVDLLALGVGWRLLGWLNYLFVWLAVHQLGFAWQAGRIGPPRRSLLWAAAGLAVLFALVIFGPYPITMVTTASQRISNSLPPRITLLALGVAQTGLLLALERPARRLLERGALWTTTVLINGMIMTVFLWHVTALVTTIGLIFVIRGWDSFFVLAIVPGTAAWWLARPLWIAVLVVALIPFIALFTRFERIGQARHGPAPPAPRLATPSRLRPRLPRPLNPHPPRHPHRNLARHQPLRPRPPLHRRRPRLVQPETQGSSWGLREPCGKIRNLERQESAMQTDNVKIERGSDNVFADLGRPNAGEHLLKAQLVTRIEKIIRQRKLKHVDAAAFLGLSQPDLSRLLRGKFREYSVERLLRLLTAPSDTMP